eukprot:gene6464-7125_t
MEEQQQQQPVDQEETKEIEEYKQLANDLKDQGNEAFQAGNIEEAIKLFSQAIDLDPDNHIFYSNRSAAYMKADSKSKALHDAEKCVELAPNWSKGYNRLGVAQQSLRRFDAAITSFKKGIELDCNNQALWSALKACEEALLIDKDHRFQAAAIERQAEEERMKRRNEIRQEILREKEAAQADDMLQGFFSDLSSAKEVEEENVNKETSKPVQEAEDDLLASFFTEVTSSVQPETASEEVEATGEEEEVIVLTEKYAQQDLGSGREQVERLLAKHHEWKNLNPYYVLQLDVDANDEDIKFRYKKLSLKVHPDRLRNLPEARDAFEQVKEAYAKLMDPDQRRMLVMHIENVTTDLLKERRKLINKGAKESDLPNFEEERQKALMKHFAELEMMRRKSDQNRRAYSAREKMQESAEEEKLEKTMDFEKKWADEDRRDKRVGNWREFQEVPVAKKVRPANYKEESRDEAKFGVVKLEAWKKSWK